MEVMRFRRVSPAILLALLVVACAACSPTEGTSPRPSSAGAATSSTDDPDALLRTALMDYNDRNNVAIVAANALDPTKWKFADTGPLLEKDLVSNVQRRYAEEPRKPAEPFDMVAVRQLGPPVASGQGRWMLGLVTGGPRGAATATPPTGGTASADSSGSSTGTPTIGVRRKLIAMTQANPTAPWLIEMSGVIPEGIGDLASPLPATEAQQAAALAVVKAALAYMADSDWSAGVDLGSIPAGWTKQETPRWGQKDTALVCTVDTDASGAPYMRSVSTSSGVLGLGAFHCTYTLTFSKASAIPKLLDAQKALWGNPTGNVLTIPLQGWVTVRVVEGVRPQVLAWSIDDGMAPDLIAAAAG